MKSAFLHRTGGEIRQWMRDENDTDVSHLHASMWEQLRNKQHVKAVCGKRGVRRYRELIPSALLPRKSNELWSFFGAQPAARSRGSQELCSVCVRVRVSEQAGTDSLSGLAGWDEDQARGGIWLSSLLWFSNWGLRLGGKLTGFWPSRADP